ncbi:MAG: beta-galactosidase [Victivallaceae bacterium]|nr:beta-galactosidase [Victivallaceae bacterium]
MKKSILCLLCYGLVFVAMADKMPVPGDYGIVAHLARRDFPDYRKRMDLLREVGVTLVRFDFDWQEIEPRRKEFRFEKYDRIVEAARVRGLTILPILCGKYDRKRISAPYRHMEEFLDYVRACVERYQGKIRYWEVMNEANVRMFWGDTPDAEKYARLLSSTGKLIKSIDPSAVVLHSGMARVPLDFIETGLKNATAENYDVMNIHPYCWKEVPEFELPARLNQLHNLLKKYKVDDRELWATEMGNSTGPNQMAGVYQIVEKGLSICQIAPEKTQLVVLSDDKYCFYSDEDMPLLQKKFKSVRAVAIAEISRLDPAKNPVILFAPREEFPCSELPKIRQYVQKGGTIILHGGLPFYFDVILEGDNQRRVSVGAKYIKDMRIGWRSWWIDKNIPKRFSSFFIPSTGKTYLSDFTQGQIITPCNLRKGDRMIPLAFGVENDLYYPSAGVFQFNSDFKGNVILCTSQRLSNNECCTEDRQAKLLGRNALLLKGNGVKRFFVYTFSNGEPRPATEHRLVYHRETHFGIVRHNLEPKKAYHAYRTLIRMCPDGSSEVKISRKGKLFIASWQTPGKEFRYGVWTYGRRPVATRIQCKGAITGAVDYLGKEISVNPENFVVSDGIVFLSGPESVHVTERETVR